MSRRPVDQFTVAKRRVRSAIMRQSTRDYARAVKDLQRLVHDRLRAKFGKREQEMAR